ncbi:Xaa-Pro aminopeptidase [Candidatus Izimaplasma bacterium HR1]|jgi:Xaa-Pro aminopeptidase|uniref:aminopeptidase P family protein n=1 Tax=Candidatus Izimoplasma sp. HR1 TaxID=1541959 RepID=UPI0004F76298|nr:Xaa-Pro aminopeptidase [Candidatus Izimaplasma bacterium HR1]
MNPFLINRNRLFEQLDEDSVLLLHSGNAPHRTTDQFYPFLVSKNFFYLTGVKESNCTLMLIKTKKESKSFLFIDETTKFMKQWVGEKISKEEASTVSEIDIKNIMFNPVLEKFVNKIMTYTRGNNILPPNVMYLDMFRPSTKHDPLAYKEYKKFIDKYPELQVKNLNEHTSYLRMFKNKYEIDDLKKAIRITNEGIKRMMKEVEHRYYENQVEADFMHEITLNGTRKVGFDTILASGKNATILHYEDNNQRIEKNSLILCDLGAEWDEYSADISRTFPSSGEFSDRQKELYEIVLKTNKETINFVKPGLTWKELNDFAKNILITECKRIELIIEDEEISKYYYHSIGHFLGLDVHDVGQYGVTIQEGMVLTIEPGLYIKEEEIGIRIEDDVLVTKNGCINLSDDIIKEVDDIERFMR